MIFAISTGAKGSRWHSEARPGEPLRSARLSSGPDVGAGRARRGPAARAGSCRLECDSKKPIERFASARSGRPISIAGALDVHPWSWTPSATVDGLTIGNPAWERGPPLARIERASVQLKLLPLLKGDVILPQVVLEKPSVYLHRTADGRANWTFRSTRPTNAPAPPPPDFPVVRSFIINSGSLTLVDDIRKLRVQGTVQAHEKIKERGGKPFRIEGKGTLNQEPFTMRVAGGPLINLDPDEPYPFEMAIRAGNIRLDSTGRVIKPFDMGHVELGIDASGDDLADLYYLTQLTLPNTPPFRFKAKMRRDVDIVKVTDIDGTLGRSDLSGTFTSMCRASGPPSRATWFPGVSC